MKIFVNINGKRTNCPFATQKKTFLERNMLFLLLPTKNTFCLEKLITFIIKSLVLNYHSGQKSCKDTEFKCGSGICIPDTWKCDNDDDCVDGSDEHPDICSGKLFVFTF
jgi:hypothetical protein